MYDNLWTVIEPLFDRLHKQHHLESVFTLGNGYLGTRGTFEEGFIGATPATFINGVYDDIAIAHTELANCPDWLPITIWVNGEYFRLDRGEVLSYQRKLDLRRGVLSRDIRWRSRSGRTLDLHFERFTSLNDQNLAAIRCQITPLDFSGTIEVQAGINGYPDNQGVKHWEWLEQGRFNNRVWLHLRTLHSHIELGIAAQLTALERGGGTTQTLPVLANGCTGYPTLTSTYLAQPGKTVTFDKVVAIFTTRETATPVPDALSKLDTLPDYETLLTAHVEAWAEVWEKSDIVIEGDEQAQLAVRYNLFQLLQAVPRRDTQVSVPAKTLSGFAYRGHVFWDTEVFILPFLIFTQPDLARNLLTYRYHTLPGARRKAETAGYEGAMFAWESANTGDEVTPRWVPHPSSPDLIRIWCGDIEQHITVDIAYAVWFYWYVTGDDEWMRQCGAEIILDTAKFWGSRAEWNAESGRYELRDVIGPDEYHDHVNNNTFTNRMVQWHLETALSVWDWLQQTDAARAEQLADQLSLTGDRLTHWQDVQQKLWILYNSETHLIEQAEGFFKLEDIDLQEYEPRQRSMQALLGIEGANERQVLKQADVLMLLYLLRFLQPSQQTALNYNRSTLQTNWDYYCPRTDHTYGSSLSPAIHAVLACDLDKPNEAYEHFLRAALVDLEDVRGNAGEGIHAASTGGVWQSVIFGFAGIQFTESRPVAQPHLPSGWTRLKFKLCWQNRWYEFDLRADTAKPCPESSIQAVIFDLDGVLTDTAEYHYQGWKQLADEEGIPFDREANDAMRGLARRDSLLHLLSLANRQVPEEQMREMMERKNRYYLELIETISPQDLLPGVREFLEELRAAGMKIAIGSASKNARQVVQQLGIGDCVDAIADGYSVVNPKPAPDLFLHAAEQVGIAPRQCVVFEDAASGIQAALAAGMLAIGLGPIDRFPNATLVLPDLNGVHWNPLLAKLEQVRRAPARIPG